MRAYTKYLMFHAAKRRDYVRMTDELAEHVLASGIREGFLLASAMHITAGVYINDWEDGLIEDIDAWLDRIAPPGLPYRHHETASSTHHSGKDGLGPLAAGILCGVRRPA